MSTTSWELQVVQSVDELLQVFHIKPCWTQRALPIKDGGFQESWVLCMLILHGTVNMEARADP